MCRLCCNQHSNSGSDPVKSPGYFSFFSLFFYHFLLVYFYFFIFPPLFNKEKKSDCNQTLKCCLPLEYLSQLDMQEISTRSVTPTIRAGAFRQRVEADRLAAEKLKGALLCALWN